MASGKRKASIRAYVTAHHNVEDFRPYTFRFADRGSYSKNLEHMIVTAIKKEGEWHGWFEHECNSQRLPLGDFNARPFHNFYLDSLALGQFKR